MDIKGVIFQLKNEILAEDDLLRRIFKHNFSEAMYITIQGYTFKVEKVYDINNEVESLTTKSPATELSANEMELISLQRKMYRTYKADSESQEATDALYNYLQASQSVEYVQYNQLNKVHFAQSTQIPSEETWGIKRIKCKEAWDISSKGDGIIVAVIDTGVDYNHPDLQGNMFTANNGTHGRDISENDDNPINEENQGQGRHGTHIAGTIAAVGNGFGVIGAAPKAQIMAVKIFPKATDDVCADAIRYAADNKVRVLNNSWEPSIPNERNVTIEEAIDYAYCKGCIVIFAAGNANKNVRRFSPANYHRVISVAATTDFDTRQRDSNYGNLVTIAAPGLSIKSLLAGGSDYISIDGTSSACAHVSGVVALLLGENKSLTFEQIKDIICRKADKITPDELIGAGIINAFESIKEVKRLSLLNDDHEKMTFALRKDDNRKEETVLTITTSSKINITIQSAAENKE